MAAVALLTLTGTAVGVAPSASAVQSGPGVAAGRNITAFINIDMLVVRGYGSATKPVTIKVLRPGRAAPVGTVTALPYDVEGAYGLEVNHGPEEGEARDGDCWEGPVPDIQAGDVIQVIANGDVDQVTVDDIRFTGRPRLAGNGDVLVKGVAKDANGRVISAARLDSGGFRDTRGKYRAEPDTVTVTADGVFTMRYKKPFTGTRNRNRLNEQQRRDALLTQDGHSAGHGHADPLPKESMLVDGIANHPANVADGC